MSCAQWQAQLRHSAWTFVKTLLIGCFVAAGKVEYSETTGHPEVINTVCWPV